MDSQIQFVKEEDDEGIHVLGIVATKNTWVNSRKKRREEKRRLALLQESEPQGESNGKSPLKGCASEGESPREIAADNSAVTDSSTSDHSAKRKLDDSIADDHQAKKVKIDLDTIKNPYMRAVLTVLDLDDAVKLEILYVDGSGGRDACNQLLVYLKGRFKEAE